MRNTVKSLFPVREIQIMNILNDTSDQTIRIRQFLEKHIGKGKGYDRHKNETESPEEMSGIKNLPPEEPVNFILDKISTAVRILILFSDNKTG